MPTESAAKTVPAIAVIGMAARYPGSPTLEQLWENILARRCQFRDLPDCRLPLTDYHDPDPATPDRTYGRKAAVIDGFQFDWARHRITRSAYVSTDIVHWLALSVALGAVEHAGYDRANLPRRNTGVLVGNSLTGEMTRSAGLRLRWPYVRKALHLAGKDLEPERLATLEQRMEEVYKSAFAPVTEDSLAGGLANTIAGRICNFLDLDGGGFVVDGACASSLLAVAQAAAALAAGDLDLAIAGGVDISLDPFELVGFSKVGALTPTAMRVYDQAANGFIPGEGCGMVVLRRLDDALAAGDKVHAILRGWGISSDGKGAITAPSVIGQSRAFVRAYTKAGQSPHRLDFVEGHGTGTTVGDQVELLGLAKGLSNWDDNGGRDVGITSFKSIFGHTKAAAGIGGFIKACLAVNQRVIPPTAGCTHPTAVFQGGAQGLYPLLAGAVRDPNAIVRGGVSAMGFGGINCHVTVESPPSPAIPMATVLPAQDLLGSAQETEILLMGASSASELGVRLAAVANMAAGMSQGELPDLARRLVIELPSAPAWRAAVVCSGPDELMSQLKRLQAALADASNPDADLFLGHPEGTPRLGFLFPGQGSQVPDMGVGLPGFRSLTTQADTCLREDLGKDLSASMILPRDRLLKQADLQAFSARLASPEIAQPAICLVSLAALNFLRRLGLEPAVCGGHSLGELTAFHACGAFDSETLLRLAAVRGQAMMAPTETAGSMASLACDEARAREIISGLPAYVTIANRNAPQQTVLSGSTEGIDAALAVAEAQGIPATRLRVGNAFHSRLVEGASMVLRRTHLLPERLGPLTATLLGCGDGLELQPGLDPREHFARQALDPVDFIALARAMAARCDLLLEVGPGTVLSKLSAAVLGKDGPPCLALEPSPGGTRGLHRALAELFVRGCSPHWEALFANRLIRPFVPVGELQLLTNPCETLQAPSLAPVRKDAGILPVAGIPENVLRDDLAKRGDFISAVIAADLQSMRQPVAPPMEPSDAAPNAEEIVLALAAKYTGYPSTSITLDASLLDDLNLDSIKAGALVAEAARSMGLQGTIDPTQFANASIREVVAVLRRQKNAPGKAENASTAAAATQPPEPEKPKAEAWVRPFTIRLFPEARPVTAAADWSEKRVLLLSDPAQPALSAALGAAARARGATVKELSPENLGLLARAGLDPGPCAQLICILPRELPRELSFAKRLERIVEYLHATACTAVACARSAPLTVSFLQFSGTPEMDPLLNTAPALAKCLFLEQPDLTVRVLDLPAEGAAESMVAEILGDLDLPQRFVQTNYDRALVRRIPRPILTDLAGRPRIVPRWNANDVILATGGAKGITAECALGLGRASGAILALVGSSQADSGVESTLARFRAAGIRCGYFPCDLREPARVKAMLASVETELGPVTGILHGAGINQFARVEQTSVADAMDVLGAKVIGLTNLLDALADRPLKLLVGLSSIIGTGGMHGNTWYAFANEALNLIIDRHGKDHPGEQALAVAFSIWEGTGMGQRMGSIEPLLRLGFHATRPAEGVQRFLAVLDRDLEERHIVLTGRLNVAPTWSPPIPTLPRGLRLLDDVTYLHPGVEAVVRTQLTLARDPYLVDHDFRGSLLFPTVFGLEAMAQVVAQATGNPDMGAVAIKDIELLLPILVPPESGTWIEIHALAGELDDSGMRTIRAGIRTEQTGFRRDHFAATFILGGALLPTGSGPADHAPLPLDPDRELYGSVLFQGPRFRRIRDLRDLNHGEGRPSSCVLGCRLDLGQAATDAGDSAQMFLLGDPFLRDAMLQSIQVLHTPDVCLPVRIGHIQRLRGTPATPGLVLVHATAHGPDADATVRAATTAGEVFEVMTGYQLRVLDRNPKLPTPAQLLNQPSRDGTALEEALNLHAGYFGLPVGLVLLSAVPGMHGQPREERHRREALLLAEKQAAITERFATSPELRLVWHADGRPFLEDPKSRPPGISITHDEQYLLCYLDDGNPGVDLQPVADRAPDVWLASLPPDCAIPFAALLKQGEESGSAGTRLWCALEAVRKSMGVPITLLEVAERHGQGVLLRCPGLDGAVVVTFPVPFPNSEPRMVAVAGRML